MAAWGEITIVGPQAAEKRSGRRVTGKITEAGERCGDRGEERALTQ